MRRHHRPLLGAACAVLAVLLAGCSTSEGGNPPGPSRVEVDSPELRELKTEAGIVDCVPGDGSGELPAITLPCLGGGTEVDLSTLTGPLVINFWASNCQPCREEMPALEEFSQQYGDQVGVLGIDYLDTLPGAALKLAQQTGVTYPLLADPGGEVGTQLSIPGLPVFVLIDEDGAIVHRTAGGIDSAAEVADMVEEHLDVDLSETEGRS